MTQDSAPLEPWERQEHLLLLPIPSPEQLSVLKAAWGRYFTHLRPTSVLDKWVVDLPLRFHVCFHTAHGACENYM